MRGLLESRSPDVHVLPEHNEIDEVKGSGGECQMASGGKAARSASKRLEQILQDAVAGIDGEPPQHSRLSNLFDAIDNADWNKHLSRTT